MTRQRCQCRFGSPDQRLRGSADRAANPAAHTRVKPAVLDLQRLGLCETGTVRWKGRIRTFRPSQDQCLSELVEPCAERRSLDKSSLGRDRGRTAGFAPKAPFADRLRRELHSQTTSRDRSNTWTMPNSTGCSRPLLSYGPTELSSMRDRWFESVSLQR